MTPRRLAAVVEGSTRPAMAPAWALLLLVWLALEAFDVVDLHISLDPTPLEAVGLTVQHMTGLLLAIPAALTAWRVIRKAGKGGAE